MNKGKYIVIEGAEGVGKTTMVQLIAYQLQAAQIPVKIMREPDSQNDLTARALRHLLLDPRYPMTTRTEVLLFNAARVQSLDVIKMATENGVTCLVDRSYLTTLANQYYGRGDITDYQKINDIIEFAVNDMQPDLMIVLDAPVPILKARLEKRSVSHGRFGRLDEAFYERVRAGYLWEAKQRNLPVIHANEDIDTVFKHVWQYVTETLAKRNAQSLPSNPESVGALLASRSPLQAVAIEPPMLTEVLQQAESSPVGTNEFNQNTYSSDETTLLADNNKLTNNTSHTWIEQHKNGSIGITDAGTAELGKYVTNTTSSVYSFTSNISPVTIAAAMARLSRRGDDMRITLLDEFIGKVEKDAELLHRVITAYGDDSVQQLTGHYIVVENASNLLTKKLEWGRLAAYLEQSTRYIYFDQKDTNGHYRYYVPEGLRGKLRSQYIKTMNQIFDIYSTLVANLTQYVRANSSIPKNEQDGAWRAATKAQACDAIRPLLPVATKSTVGIYASGQALESLIMHLMSDDLVEARSVGQQILDEARKTDAAVFLERADKPERGGATIAYRATTYSGVQKLALNLLSSNHTGEANPVTLSSYTPHNELEVVADILYEHSDLSLSELRQAVADWPYEQKVQVLHAYMGERLNRRHRPGRALEKIHYSFDLVCDYGIFRDLQRHRIVDDLAWQALTPRMGYDTPALVEEAGLSDMYDEAFDLSLQLYSALQAGGKQLDAQYATLLGHKMRWKFTMNAREAFHFIELRTSPQGHPGYRKLTLALYDKIAEVHPLLAGAMRFVNQGEDEELTRLAAERYTQYKLDQLDSSQTG